MGFSFGHILLVVFVVLIVFGAGKLPAVMGDLAKGVKNFKKAMNEDDDDTKPADKSKTD